MMKVNVLSGGLATPNGRAFLYPILRFRDALKDVGIDANVYFEASPTVAECDLLAIDSKYYRPKWPGGASVVLDELAGLRSRAGKVFWFDNSDSTGALQTSVLPEVDAYCKAQLLKDRSRYFTRWYGGRIFTDYYHRKHGIDDSTPGWSIPISSTSELAKLRTSWNPGLYDH